MSWLSAMTGKAEDFLNKLDKTAADAFHAAEDTHSKVPAPQPVTFDHLHKSFQHVHTPLSAPVANVPAHSTSKSVQPAATSVSKMNLKSAAISAVSAATRIVGDTAPPVKRQSSVNRQDSDEALFDFLNSKEPSEGNRKRVAPMSVKQQCRQVDSESSREDSGKSSQLLSGQVQSVIASAWGSGGWSLTEDADAVHTPTTAESAEADPIEYDQCGSPTHSHESADPEALADAMKESPPDSISSSGEPEQQHDRQTRLSALLLENSLLKNEVSSLNQEITSLIEHAKKSQTELVKMKEKLSENSSSASQQEALVQEVQARERDLQDVLRAKDAQLAVMRVQLEEADRKAASLQTELHKLHTDGDRLAKAQGSGAQSQAVDILRQKLVDMETLLNREQQAHTQYQRETSERHSRMEKEQKALVDAVTAAEKKICEEKAKAAEASSQLKTVRTILESTKEEMAEYKEKASRILQSKDRLITSLRDGSEASGSVDGGGFSNLEYVALQQERDMLREELHKAKFATDSMRTELQDVEVQLQQEMSQAQDSIRALEDMLTQEQQHRQEVEQELLMQKQDLQYTLDDLHRQKVNFQTCLGDREAEIEKLRGQLTTKSLSSTSESELEWRVRSLTESLIQKQTLLESLSTQNSSLTLQLERLGQQYRDAEHNLMRSAMASHRADAPEDDMRQRLPVLVREGVTDTEVTRKVKHYVNSIDRFSIRLGIFLRRYPAARVFVLVYMLLLHLWVLVVLATHQQEMHS